MEKTELQRGDVVQIDPKAKNCAFRNCMMIVIELKPWGAKGIISVPGNRDVGPGLAIFQAEWDIMELIGHAKWLVE